MTHLENVPRCLGFPCKQVRHNGPQVAPALAALGPRALTHGAEAHESLNTVVVLLGLHTRRDQLPACTRIACNTDGAWACMRSHGIDSVPFVPHHILCYPLHLSYAPVLCFPAADMLPDMFLW